MAPTNTVSRQSLMLHGPLTKQPLQQREKDGQKDDTIPQITYTAAQLAVLRLVVAMGIAACWVYSDFIQGYINSFYGYLRHQWWFEMVYFETALVIVFSFPATAVYQVLNMISYFDKYKIEKKGGGVRSESIPENAVHAVEYILPLFLLDTFHVKHYYGVGDEVVREKRKDWIQRTRALPDYAPQLGDIILHIFIAIVIYDVLFCTIHYNLHKNPTLYRIFHKKHHTHDVINAKETDHQHWMERVGFILCANFGLKIQGAHPLTRMLFVFVFIGLLIYSHCGYDFPFALDKIVPFGLVSSSRQHYEHHAKGKRYYQFIFTYIDNMLESRRQREKDKQKDP